MTAGVVALSRQQVNALLADRLDGAGLITVDESLDWAALMATNVVPGARLLMDQLEQGRGRLTGLGYINRKLVGTLVDQSSWPGEDREMLRSICKVIDEENFPPALYLHAILRVARMARHERGSLKLTRKGKSYLPEDAAGRLQAELFRLTFTRYNLTFLDRIGAPDLFAQQIGLILYLIGQFCTHWMPADELMRSVTLPIEELREPQSLRDAAFAFELRVLRYLCWFGLLEQSRPAANDDWRQPNIYRKAQLYDRALCFALK